MGFCIDACPVEPGDDPGQRRFRIEPFTNGKDLDRFGLSQKRCSARYGTGDYRTVILEDSNPVAE